MKAELQGIETSSVRKCNYCRGNDQLAQSSVIGRKNADLYSQLNVTEFKIEKNNTALLKRAFFFFRKVKGRTSDDSNNSLQMFVCAEGKKFGCFFNQRPERV